MLYTIIPIEFIFDSDSENGLTDGSLGEVELRQGTVSLVAKSLPGGQYKITRIISTDPQDYLKPKWQPGTLISFY